MEARSVYDSLKPEYFAFRSFWVCNLQVPPLTHRTQQQRRDATQPRMPYRPKTRAPTSKNDTKKLLRMDNFWMSRRRKMRSRDPLYQTRCGVSGISSQMFIKANLINF